MTWLDSGLHLDEGWAPIDQYVAKAKQNGGYVRTVGLLCYEDESIVVVGLSLDMDHGHIFGAQVIYRQNIVHIQRYA